MTQHAAITVLGPPEEIRSRWSQFEHAKALDDATVSFRPAPGDRGTEIHVDLAGRPSGDGLAGVVKKVTGAVPLAKVKDELRHFKQLTETGEVPRSEGTPEGERFERKLKQRPAQPLSEAERQEVGV
jgi:uncharacterized membrane protein